MSNVLRIDMQSRAMPPLDVRGNHVHTCPWCLHDVSCEDTCTVEPDLTRDDGTMRGSHVGCDACSGVGR